MKYIFVDTDAGTSQPGTAVHASSSWPAAGDCFSRLNTAFAHATVQAETDSITFYCRGAADDTLSTTLSDTVLSQDVTIIGETTTPVYDTSKYQIRNTGASANCFVISKTTGTVTLRNLQVTNAPTNTQTALRTSASTGTLTTLIEQCLIGTGGAPTSGFAVGFGAAPSTASITVRNCVIWCDAGSTGRTGIDSTGVASTTSLKIYNNVVTGFATGINRRATGGANMLFKNNAVFSNTDDFGSGSATITLDYNASDDGDGTNAVTGVTWTNVFEDYANQDFRVKSGNALIGAGIGPTSDANVPTTDFYGNSRTGTTTDIGASMYVGTGLTVTGVSPSNIDSGESVTITGTGFGASQGTSFVKIGNDEQTVTSWGDTSIVFTAARGAQSMGNATLTVVKV